MGLKFVITLCHLTFLSFEDTVIKTVEHSNIFEWACARLAANTVLLFWSNVPPVTHEMGEKKTWK